MTNLPIDDLIKYRIARAVETLAEAKIMAESGHWNTCINRLYYGCFYSVNALLIKHNLSSVKHSGVKSLFNREFVNKKIIPVEISEIYNELFNLRHESDYEDFYQAEEKLVQPLIQQVERFIDYMQKLL